MHELSVCQGLVGQLEAVAAEHGAGGVRRVTLRVGPLSGVEPRLLEEAFPIARAGTVAAAAELIIEPQPVRVECLECGAGSEASANRLLCGACGAWRTRVVSGDEMVLASVELEFEEEKADV